MELILSIESSCDDSCHLLLRQSSRATLTALTLGSARRSAHTAEAAQELSSWS